MLYIFDVDARQILNKKTESSGLHNELTTGTQTNFQFEKPNHTLEW